MEGRKGEKEEARKKGTTRQRSNSYGCGFFFLELLDIYIFKPSTLPNNPHIWNIFR
jgi:hypothetical protein